MFERGSEWRRWDLHVHTPDTKKNDRYEGATLEEKWDKFYDAINKYVATEDETKQIAALGITDYCSIDNYKKVVDDNRLSDKILAVFPNVELRITPVATSSPVNMHFIFNPDIVDELENRFFNKLEFLGFDRKYNGSKSDLIALGKQLGASNDEDAYKKGIDSFVVSHHIIRELFESDKGLRENTLIGIANSSTDGASGIDRGENGGQLTATKKVVYQLCDFIFSGNNGDIQYFCGNGCDDKEKVISQYGSLKPCFHGSDAHELRKLFEPSNERYCWIKADTSFNGLRQVIYEPEERVYIGPIKPESKSDYYVIDKVELADDGFSPEPIVFNDKLTCIIGGKSTGKSLLLQNIARTIDEQQVDERLEVSNNSSKTIKNVKVYWKDGEISVTGKHDSTHKITYIPQTYLNRLTDEAEAESEIDTIIHTIIMQNEDCKASHESMLQAINDCKPDLDKKIYDLLKLFEEIELLSDQKNSIGVEAGIKKEIAKLKHQIDIISKKAAISEKEVNQYNSAINIASDCQKNIQICEDDLKLIDSVENVVRNVVIPSDISDDYKKIILDFQKDVIRDTREKWNSKKEELVELNTKKKDAFLDKKNNALKTIEELSEKVRESESLQRITELIKEEEQNLKDVEELSKKIVKKQEEYRKLLDEIASAAVEYKFFHKKYADIVNQNERIDNDELEFNVIVVFRNEAFKKYIFESINNTSLKKEGYNKEDINESIFSKDFIESLVDKIITGKLRLVRAKTKESVVREILKDWFFISYNVRMENDDINQMSPGKKALVLLKLLISMQNSKYPILIDQPEDDLDNRSIFDELIPFIREKKINRQIIIVTHNANVVLGGDAEEIIVANQNGKNTANEKYRFEYRSGSIENDKSVYYGTNVREGILNAKGIQQHICDILEGGELAFDLRKNKYHI